jgi:hypothetical protein
LSASPGDEYGWRFQEFHPLGEGAIFGIENVSDFSVIRCPVCGQLVWVPKGHFDTTHDCTVICPYSGDQMWYIPQDPSTAKDRNGNPIVLNPNSAPQWIESRKRYFMYCPNPTCTFIVEYGFAFTQRRVEVDFQVGR